LWCFCAHIVIVAFFIRYKRDVEEQHSTHSRGYSFYG
jgi:hypothetical protein